MQITLDRATQAKVRRRAQAFGIPVAEYVRRVIAADLGDEPPKSTVAEIFDLGRSGEPTDIARHKDEMIAEAIADPKLRE